jgi:outer membrane protein assembly factor BamB
MKNCSHFGFAAAVLGVLAVVLPSPASADDWPQWMGPKRDGVWREAGVIDRIPAGGLTRKWTAGINFGYSGPAVADGKVFAFDFAPAAFPPANDPGKRSELAGKERVFAFSAEDGKTLWKRTWSATYRISYPAGPRCTPTVADGKVYALGAEGHLECLDAADGKVIWSKEFSADYKAETPIWGYAAHPLVDGKRLICMVGGPGATVVAFDKDTGAELWKSGLTEKGPGYCPPQIAEAGGKRQLIVWHAEAVAGLDPETGKPYWSVPLPAVNGAAIAAPQVVGDTVFAAGPFDKSVLISLSPGPDGNPAAKVVWTADNKRSMFCVNVTPLVVDGVAYGVCGKGELRAVKLADGSRLWETFAATGGKRATSGTAFITRNGDRWFLFSETGELIIAKLSPAGYEELGRTKLIEPTGEAWGRKVVWSHPAYAGKCIFVRNDREIACYSLAEPAGK